MNSVLMSLIPFAALSFSSASPSSAAPILRDRLSTHLVAEDSVCKTIDTPPSKTEKMVGFARIVRSGSDKPLPDEYASVVAEAIAAHIDLPKPLGLPVYTIVRPKAGTGNSTPSKEFFPNFSAEFLLVFRRDGSVKKTGISQSSMSAELDASLARAILVADSAGSFPGIYDVTTDDELSVFVEFGLTDSLSSGLYPVFRVTVPVYPAATIVTQLPTPGLPHVPDELRGGRVEGEVVVQMVIDEHGRVADRSYRILSATQQPFGAEVLNALPKLRFSSARIGNCAVKSLVEQSFSFKLRR